MHLAKCLKNIRLANFVFLGHATVLGPQGSHLQRTFCLAGLRLGVFRVTRGNRPERLPWAKWKQVPFFALICHLSFHIFFLFRTQLGLLSQKCWAILVEGCTGSATKCPDPHKGRNSWSVTVPAAGHPAYSQISSPWDIGTFDVSF